MAIEAPKESQIEAPAMLDSVPDTKLIDILAHINATWGAERKKLSPAQQVLLLLHESDKWQELMKFLASYISGGPDEAANGMCVMFLLGHTYAKGNGGAPRILMPDKRMAGLDFLRGDASMRTPRR